MNYYERNINSFLSSVTSNMSAVYLPAFFVSLIELLEDFYKFDAIPDGNHVRIQKTTILISHQLITAYFLSHLLKIRRQIPTIRMAPTKGKTHDERFLDKPESIKSLETPGQILNSHIFSDRCKKLLHDMMDSQNILPVFERRCPVLQLKPDHIEMDIVAVNTLLTNSILYTKMGELICFQYLSRLAANRDLGHHLEDYFLRGTGRIDFPSAAKNYVIEYQGHHCYYCEQKLDDHDYLKKPRADHFIPWVFLKSSVVENLVYACNSCNSIKLDRLPSVSFFNKLLRRNTRGSDFWQGYTEDITNLDERINKWARNYYQASEQLSTGWMPDGIA
ncbi:MAG TPA: HNH endonuclease [Spirochaetia bacterium]|nr:HNH endonuclease [Spirochaetia bacterium]